MGLSGIGKSTVSKLCKEIDERVGAFLDRPLEGEWPYLWLDATYLKVREGGRIVPVAAIVAVAVDAEGRREIVGLGLGASEAEPFWSTFLKGLLRRGLRGVRLVISDAHEGLKHAIAKVLGAAWQRCRVHWMRDALAHARAQGAAQHGRRRAPPGVPASRPGGRAPGLAAAGRPAPPPLAQARRPHGRERARRARLHGLPPPAPDRAALHQSARAAGQGGEAAGRRGRPLPGRALDHAPDRSAPCCWRRTTSGSSCGTATGRSRRWPSGSRPTPRPTP